MYIGRKSRRFSLAYADEIFLIEEKIGSVITTNKVPIENFWNCDKIYIFRKTFKILAFYRCRVVLDMDTNQRLITNKEII